MHRLEEFPTCLAGDARSVERYHVVNQTFVTGADGYFVVGDLPQERYGASAAIFGNSLYVSGGRYENGSFAVGALQAQLLTASAPTQPFVSVAPASTGGLSLLRTGHCAATFGEYQLIFGGFDGARLFSDVIMFNFTAGAYRNYTDSTTGTFIPAARWNQSCAIVESKLYVFGGATSKDGLLRNDLWYINADATDTNRTWQLVPVSGGGVAPAARSGAAIVSVDTNFVLFGGRASDNSLISDIWLFNSSALAWVQLTHGSRYPSSRMGAAMDEINGKIIVNGGLLANNMRVSSIWTFDATLLASNAAAQIIDWSSESVCSSVTCSLVAFRTSALDVVAHSSALTGIAGVILGSDVSTDAMLVQIVVGDGDVYLLDSTNAASYLVVRPLP